MRPYFIAVLVAISLTGLSGCSENKPQPVPESTTSEAKTYQLTGVIEALDPQEKLARINHEKIGDWMDAMIMEFPVKENADWSKLKVGDKIKATVVVKDYQYHIKDVEVVSSTDPVAK